MKRKLLLAALLLPLLANAQVTKDIQTLYPKAKSTTEIKGQWTQINGPRNHVLGYVAYSKPASNNIRGYAGETPLLIAFDKNQKIIAVKLLSNNETPSYVNRIAATGFLNSWNGLTPTQARTKKVDAVSGATYTSTSIIKSLQARLKNL